MDTEAPARARRSFPLDLGAFAVKTCENSPVSLRHVCPHTTCREELNGFSLNLVLEGNSTVRSPSCESDSRSDVHALPCSQEPMLSQLNPLTILTLNLRWSEQMFLYMTYPTHFNLRVVG
jgi:hypothetical protein